MASVNTTPNDLRLPPGLSGPDPCAPAATLPAGRVEAGTGQRPARPRLAVLCIAMRRSSETTPVMHLVWKLSLVVPKEVVARLGGAAAPFQLETLPGVCERPQRQARLAAEALREGNCGPGWLARPAAHTMRVPRASILSPSGTGWLVRRSSACSSYCVLVRTTAYYLARHCHGPYAMCYCVKSVRVSCSSG